MADVLDPLTLRGLTTRNRAWMPAMCMYSVTAGDGVPTDFHLTHYASRAAGGFGLVITEATAVSPEGRISPADTGLWNEAQTAAWRRITDLAHSLGGAIGVQLAHAGRKASTRPLRPNEPGGSLPVAEGGWPTVGPTSDAYPGLAEPHGLSGAEIDGVIADFRAAAARADAAGFDVIEAHAAHGYLLHQFLSPLTNHRTDEYGGTLENRFRLTLRVVDAIRSVWPDSKPVFVRVSATDWIDGGWDVTQTTALAAALRYRGVDLIDVSTGGVAPAQIPIERGYQVPFARQVRMAGVKTAAVGLIETVEHARTILRAGDADAVLFGRAALRDPYLPARAAADAGHPGLWTPPAYFRGWPAFTPRSTDPEE